MYKTDDEAAVKLAEEPHTDMLNWLDRRVEVQREEVVEELVDPFPITLHELAMPGSVEEFAGLQTYITGPRNSKRAIVLLSDAVGNSASLLLIIHGSSHLFFHVLIFRWDFGAFGPSSFSYVPKIPIVSPWSFSVAANTIDMKFIANVQLGNDQVLGGNAVNTFQLNDTTYPLLWGGSIPNSKAGFTPDDSRYCTYDSLDSTKCNGTILLCDVMRDASVQYTAGTVGTAMRSNTNDYAFSFLMPSLYL